MVKNGLKILLPWLIIIIGCASVRTNVNFYNPILNDLKLENYSAAVKKIDNAKVTEKYTKKDRVLFYLDKGVTHYYNGDYQESNDALQNAENYMEELFTQSISKAALSFLLNDNALDYYGEVYENIYTNIFKALNYIHLNQFDDAYVEVNRVNDKLRELDVKYGEMIESLNKSDDAKIKIENVSTDFSSDVLSHYLSYIIYRADGERDNARISFEKMVEAWRTQPDIYNFAKPASISNPPKLQGSYLNVIAFAGFAPYKKAVGGKITTYDDMIGISSLEMPITVPNIPFPGSKEGYHFKFSFPVIRTIDSNVNKVIIRIDNRQTYTLDLLEDMGKVAVKTFNKKRQIIYVKTIVRTVLKGLAATEAKKKLKKETKAKGGWASLLDAVVDVGVDATENADLRCWRMMPRYCFAGEIPVQSGNHSIEIDFMNKNNILIKKKSYPNFNISNKLNLIDAVLIN